MCVCVCGLFDECIGSLHHDHKHKKTDVFELKEMMNKQSEGLRRQRK